MDFTWARSSLCDSSNCVEWVTLVESVLVRHSEDPDGTTLRFSLAEWDAFIAGVKNNEAG